ncbi:hypothetical protein J6590_072109 [Homalodisca vitripennis]|nr:hypothetical protein J6590_072109 [Homalodisca vitripennis]
MYIHGALAGPLARLSHSGNARIQVRARSVRNHLLESEITNRTVCTCAYAERVTYVLVPAPHYRDTLGLVIRVAQCEYDPLSTPSQKKPASRTMGLTVPAPKEVCKKWPRQFYDVDLQPVYPFFNQWPDEL